MSILTNEQVETLTKIARMFREQIDKRKNLSNFVEVLMTHEDAWEATHALEALVAISANAVPVENDYQQEFHNTEKPMTVSAGDNAPWPRY